MIDDDQPPSQEELASAEALRRALERDLAAAVDGVDGEVHAAALISATAGHSAPLGDLAALAVARAAFAKVVRRPRLRYRWAAGALVAASLLLVFAQRAPTPRSSGARSPEALTPGPFPAGQTAARRLDRVMADRMVALRETRLYGARR